MRPSSDVTVVETVVMLLVDTFEILPFSDLSDVETVVVVVAVVEMVDEIVFLSSNLTSPPFSGVRGLFSTLGE